MGSSLTRYVASVAKSPGSGSGSGSGSAASSFKIAGASPRGREHATQCVHATSRKSCRMSTILTSDYNTAVIVAKLEGRRTNVDECTVTALPGLLITLLLGMHHRHQPYIGGGRGHAGMLRTSTDAGGMPALAFKMHAGTATASGCVPGVAWRVTGVASAPASAAPPSKEQARRRGSCRKQCTLVAGAVPPV